MEEGEDVFSGPVKRGHPVWNTILIILIIGVLGLIGFVLFKNL